MDIFKVVIKHLSVLFSIRCLHYLNEILASNNTLIFHLISDLIFG